ncbi:flagellar motor protein [Myxosarcina sp. GI1]|uniref:flagellar motor protein n=1 Tax=Myxosarcina sp. GI1 TaxID=1541065 RepID=UPI000568CF68|nr:flagellar motor protein [Myxosarcina sp. GI1]
MRKRSLRDYDSTETLNVWQSFTDLMANAFLIISLFLLLALFKSLFLKYTADETAVSLSETERRVRLLQREIAALENELGESTDEIRQLQRGSARLKTLLNKSNSRIENREAEIESLESKISRLTSAPPVVVIQDSGEYQFNSGSAELPSELQDYIISDLVDRIEQISKQRNLYVVEIIGHTDGQVNAVGSSNLDRELEAVANGQKQVSSLNPGSNADLGLMRALEVVKQLKAVQRETGRLEGVEFRAYSAAQLLFPSGDFADSSREPNPSRRRIEIRFSPLGRAETVRQQ